MEDNSNGEPIKQNKKKTENVLSNMKEETKESNQKGKKEGSQFTKIDNDIETKDKTSNFKGTENTKTPCNEPKANKIWKVKVVGIRI